MKGNLTLNHVVDLYLGVKKEKKVAHHAKTDGSSLFGHGKGCSEEDAQRLVRKLVIDGLLVEETKKNKHRGAVFCYVKVSKEGRDFIKKKEPRASLVIRTLNYFSV